MEEIRELHVKQLNVTPLDKLLDETGEAYVEVACWELAGLLEFRDSGKVFYGGYDDAEHLKRNMQMHYTPDKFDVEVEDVVYTSKRLKITKR